MIFGRAATAAGSLLRAIGKGFPGTVGPALVVVGVLLFSIPAGIILAGLILWALDRRIP